MINFDSDGLIKSQSDYGDCAANIGTYYACQILSNTFHKDQWLNAFNQLRVSPGRYIRHVSCWPPYPDQYFSRDQLYPILCTLVLLNDKAEIKHFLKDHLKRILLFMPNIRRNGSTPDNHGVEYKPGKKRNYRPKLPDFTLLKVHSLIWRGLGLKNKLLLNLLDLEALFNSTTQYIFGPKPDCRNHILTLLTVNKVSPTITSKLAQKIYFKMDIKLLVNSWWHRSTGRQPMNELILPLISRL